MIIHSVLSDYEHDWKQWVQAQGVNECGVTAPANALNILHHQPLFDKNDFLRQARWFFQRQLGGSPSFVTAWLLKRHGAGTHFGNIRPERGGDALFRDLIDRGNIACIELGQNMFGPWRMWGEHSVVLTGYGSTTSDTIDEYYLLDSQITHADGSLVTDIIYQGKAIPGNRVYKRDDFWQAFPAGIYFPVFETQAVHDQWYQAHVKSVPAFPVFGAFQKRFVSGTIDQWIH